MINRMHPVTVFLWAFSEIIILMFFGNPVFYIIAFMAGVVQLLLLDKNRQNKVKKNSSRDTFLWLLAIIVVLILINPLVSHNGRTVLLVVNNKIITLEAMLYGLFAGVQIAAVFLWFAMLNRVMTTEKLMCVFGKISSKFSLLISMVLRFIPEFRKSMQAASQSARGIGRYKDGNSFDYIKQRSSEFVVVAGGALENGIITADSMEARGYSIGKRTQYTRFKYRKRDFIVLSINVLFLTFLGVLMFLGYGKAIYYPDFIVGLKAMDIVLYVGFGAFSALPLLFIRESK